MRWLAVATLSLLTFGATAHASPEDPESLDELIQAVEATYQDVQSLGADFVQVTRSVAVGEGDTQKGKVLLARPKKMRWEFTGPDARLFVTDGTQMWMYSPADKQAHVYQDLSGGGTGMESLLTNLDQLDELFDIEMLDGSGDKQSVALKLVPKNAEANFKYLRLLISKKKYLLEQVTIVDAFDNETELSFSQVKLNVQPADDRFIFVPGDDVEVIRPDGL